MFSFNKIQKSTFHKGFWLNRELKLKLLFKLFNQSYVWSTLFIVGTVWMHRHLNMHTVATVQFTMVLIVKRYTGRKPCNCKRISESLMGDKIKKSCSKLVVLTPLESRIWYHQLELSLSKRHQLNTLNVLNKDYYLNQQRVHSKHCIKHGPLYHD